MPHAVRTLALHAPAQVALDRKAPESRRDLDDEIQYHLEQQVEALVAQGAGRDEAWRTVRRNFGAIDVAKERCRDARGVDLIDTLWQDVRYAGPRRTGCRPP
jgi:hypothetical protein